MGDAAATGTVARARELLGSLAGADLSEDARIAHSVELAELLHTRAAEHETGEERTRDAQMARLMEDADGQAFTILLTDRIYRSADPARVVDAARLLLRELGVPGYLPRAARMQLQALLRLGPFAPGPAARGVLERIRRDSAHVVLAAEEPALSQHLALRRAQGARVNLNHLGEAVLGEAEAERRVAHYCELLARPDVESISVKVSSIFSQIDLLAWEATLATLTERLRVIYGAALAHRYRTASGDEHPKLVNLDMEGYRDLALTLEAFRRVMDEPAQHPLTAGVVLQAYLPEAAALQRELIAWARARCAAGAVPIRMRIVKGANLAVETAEASLRGWPCPVLPGKDLVDASYKKLVRAACDPEAARAVRVGIATHNLFDIAYGLVCRASAGTEDAVGFELLEGMADPVRRALSELTPDVLLYAPVVEEHAMQTAIAYLMRRLDENTSPENYLCHSFGMRTGDAAWVEQRERFERACRLQGELGEAPRRDQDRQREPVPASQEGFGNEPDTDFCLAHNRAWIDAILARWHDRPQHTVRLGIAGRREDGPELADGFDPSRPGHVPYRYPLADAATVERAVAAATRAGPEWANVPPEQRAKVLRAAAQELRRTRGELIAAMVLDAGKRVEQADAEVSEAIDFAEYYPHSLLSLAGLDGVELCARGVVVVTPPWNFPLAIPAGGVLASLMAGNAVILKPAPETVWVAEMLAERLWDAGVPPEVLQLVVCTDDVGSTLIEDPRVGAVVLTGATATAQLFQRMRPDLHLMAETGGKNALIVSASADRDVAIGDAVQSAFGHAGQKCSAASLLVCEAEVYDDPRFLETLADAAASLPVGSAWDRRSVVTPLIQPARDPLLRGLTSLESGERWLLEPERSPENLRLWSPGIRLEVAAGSFTHQTELFGPVLSVMRARDLDHALALANGTPYGLTAGLCSLDEREQRRWKDRMLAGNLYVNRGITGAIVRRQPFGGCKASGFGPGAKAGGPNYVLQLTQPADRERPVVRRPPTPAAAELVSHARRHLDAGARESLSVAACDYAEAWATHFGVDHDPSALVGERNVFRYRPWTGMWLRAGADAAPVDVLRACAAAATAVADAVLSLHPTLLEAHPVLADLPHVPTTVEDAAAAARRLSEAKPPRVRTLGTPEDLVLTAARGLSIHVATEPVLHHGRVELLAYLREQSIAHRYHRHGNLAPERLLAPLRRAGGERVADAGDGGSR